jgi:hypothetical protein
MVDEAWYNRDYLTAIRPSTYEPVVKSCFIRDGYLMVCNAGGLAKVFCPPVTICQKAIELEIGKRSVRVQTSYIATFASIPLDQPQKVLQEVAGYLVEWGLEVIRRDRWFMNNSEVGFESVVHFLSLCRPLWQK